MRLAASKTVPLLLLAALVALVPAVAAADPPRPLVFAPQWMPQAQFAGYYVAQDTGIYARRGLEVTILPGGPDHPPSRALAEGRADVASLWLTTAMRLRDQGTPLVNVAQLFGRSSLVLVAKKASGIRAPADLRGRKVGVWDGDFLLLPLEFFRRYDVAPQLVTLGSTVNLLLRGGVDATIATWFNEYHTILNAGVEPHELTTFFFHEHGLNFPEDGLYCLEDTVRRDPERIADFVQASLEGWQRAFVDPEAAVRAVMARMLEAHVGTNVAHQRWMLARVQDLMKPSEPTAPTWGLRRVDYDGAAEALLQSGAIGEAERYERFYRPVLIPK